MSTHVMFTAGAFGEAVAGYQGMFSQSTIRPLSKIPEENMAAMAGATSVSVAVWRPHDDAMLPIDDFCHRHGIRSSCAALRGSQLSVGPLVIPGMGSGGCYHCYLKRRGSHSLAPEHDRVLHSAYAQDWSLGVTGYITPLVAIAAGALFDDLSAASTEAGRLRVVDAVNGMVLQAKVIAVHACPRCRAAPTPLPPGERFVRHIVPAVKDALA